MSMQHAAPRLTPVPTEDRMAGPETPLIRNCWYVAAWSSEVGRGLLGRRILGEQVVLYRKEDSTPVALHDRCPHRSLALSKGCLEGDAVRCGYHGLAFDAAGACIDAPPVERPPRAMRVRSYDLVERGPLIWIWMGTQPVVEAEIPDLWWLSDIRWADGRGQMTIASNYVGLHENLLDLTHFTFLHPGTIGTPEYASAPCTVTSDASTVRVERFVAECAVPGIYRSTGLGDNRISRRATSEFLTPALHTASAELRNLSPQPGAQDTFVVRVSHFITPSDIGSTRYFFSIARDFAVQDESATEAMRTGALQAFRQDAEALEAIAQIQTAEPGFVEMSLKSDQAGVTMRRILKSMSDGDTAKGALPL